MKKKCICIALLLILTVILCACGTNMRSASIRQGDFSKHKCEMAGCGNPSVCEIKIGRNKHYFCNEHTENGIDMYNRYMSGEEITEQKFMGEEI